MSESATCVVVGIGSRPHGLYFPHLRRQRGGASRKRSPTGTVASPPHQVRVRRCLDGGRSRRARDDRRRHDAHAHSHNFHDRRPAVRTKFGGSRQRHCRCMRLLTHCRQLRVVGHQCHRRQDQVGNRARLTVESARAKHAVRREVASEIRCEEMYFVTSRGLAAAGGARTASADSLTAQIRTAGLAPATPGVEE